MLVPDIAALKELQDTLDRRESVVRDALGTVHDGLIERIVEFTGPAIAAGIRGVKLGSAQAINGQTVTKMTLNNFDVTVVLSDQVSPDRDNDILMGRILFYITSIDLQIPKLDVVVREKPERDALELFYRRDLANKTPTLTRAATASKEEGRQIAKLFINHMYSYRLIWNQTPDLDDYLKGGKASSTIGFRP